MADSDHVEIEVSSLGPEPRPWFIAASRSGLTFRREGAEQAFGATALRKRVVLSVGGLFKSTLMAKLNDGKVYFRLERDAVGRLLRGLGEELATGWMLWQRVKWFIPLALLFMLTSLPVPGDSDVGVEPLPLDVAGMTLGVGLIVLSLLARFKPMAWLLLADAAWLAAVIVDGAYAVASGVDHPAWLLLYPMLLLLLASGLRTYRALTR